MRALTMMGAALAMVFAPGCMDSGDDLGVATAAHRDRVPPRRVSCWITGGGQIHPTAAVGGSFGGNAKRFRVSGLVDGEWNHVTFDGDHFHGDPDFLVCYVGDGAPPTPPSAIPNNADFGGEGTWNGEPGYSFEVHIEDHGEPGSSDEYMITVYGPLGGVVYSAGGTVENGNLQIHPPNPGHP